MSFWEGISTDRFREVMVIRDFEDLGLVFTKGMCITVEVLEGSFYRYRTNVIPKTHCEIIVK